MKLGLEFMESEREATRAAVALLETETDVRKEEDGCKASVPPYRVVTGLKLTVAAAIGISTCLLCIYTTLQYGFLTN